MKKTPFRITLSSPCSEDLSNMQNTACGKFCNSCQKEVYDFTRLSDNEIYKIMQANNGNVCAQLTNVQLQNGFTYTEETYNNTVWLKYAASILFIGGITNAFGQSKIQKLTPIKTEQSIINNPITPNNDTLKINGTIINAVSNKPLKFPIFVELKQNKNTISSCASDNNTGLFTIFCSNTTNLDQISIILHYKNRQQNTIQVPKEHVSIEKNGKEINIVIRTAIDSEILRNNERNKNIVSIAGGMQYTPEIIQNRMSRENEYVIVDGVKIRRDNVSFEDVPSINSNGTPANMESKPIDNNKQNR
jgi:hypothetical protein